MDWSEQGDAFTDAAFALGAAFFRGFFIDRFGDVFIGLRRGFFLPRARVNPATR